MTQPHVQQRLSTRVSNAVADVAQELLRDHRALALWLVGQTVGRPEWNVPRLALALEPGATPAHLVVSLDGHGITCLASGMAVLAPEVPYVRVREYLDARTAQRRGITAMQRIGEDEALASLSVRAVSYAYNLDVEDFRRLRVVVPLFEQEAKGIIGDAAKFVLAVARRTVVPARSPKPGLAAVWQLYTSAWVHLMVVAPEKLGLWASAACFQMPDVQLAFRANWILVNRAPALLDWLAGRFDTPKGHPPGGLGRILVMVALRFPKLREHCADLFARLGKDPYGQLWPSRWLSHDQQVEDAGRGMLAMMGYVLDTQGLSYKPRFWDLPLSRAFAGGKNFKALWEEASSPVRCAYEALEIEKHWLVPMPTVPVPPPDGKVDVRTAWWRLWLRVIPVSPFRLEAAAVAATTTAPVEALCPWPEPDRSLRPSEGLVYLTQELPAIMGVDAELPGPARRPGPRVGRNAPCPCGSGKKYKHCCDELPGR